MTKHIQRPPEITNLLNPAFCGEVIRRCVESYEKSSMGRLPFALAFLILPIVLDKETRATITHYKRTIPIWVNSYPQIKIHLAERTRYLIEYTRESIIFLLQTGAVKIDLHSGMTSIEREIEIETKTTSAKDQSITEIYKKAEILGKMLAASGKPETIFSLLGVRP